MRKRVDLIDALRGFSLFGILIANLLIFQYGSVGKDFIEHQNILDKISYYFTKIFVETSFMPIFAVIFGYSLYKLFESIKSRQDKTRWPLIRRAIGLMVLGFIHSTFIWEGDILLFYGGTMFILLFFLYRKPKTMFIWAGIFFVLMSLMSISENVELYDKEKVVPYLEEEHQVFSEGTYGDVINFRLNSELPIKLDEVLGEAILIIIALLAPFMYMPLFLLGMGLAKLNYFSNPKEEMSFYKKLAIFAVVGLLLKTVGQLDFNYSDLFFTLGGPILAVGYIGLFSIMYNSDMGRKYSELFTNVGKLSLTNYLMQSILFTFIFYGYGLGLFGSIGTTFAIVLGVAVFALQIVCSQIYLRKFKRGPFEKVLRMWTNLSLK